MTTGKTKALTRWTFVGKVMSLLFNMLSRLVIAFLPRSKHLLISLAAVTISSDFGDQKKSTSALLTSAKAFDYMDHNKLWKILQEMGISDTLPAS